MKKHNVIKIISLLTCVAMFFTSCAGTPSGGSSTGSNEDPVSSEEPEPIITAEEHITKLDNGYVIYSPDKSLIMTVSDSGQLSYSVMRTNESAVETWINASKMGVTVGNTEYGKDCSITDARVSYFKEDYALLGNVSKIKGRAIEVAFSLASGDRSFSMEARVYNNGVAFRYVLPQAGSTSYLKDNTTYALRDDISECWYSVYTGEPGTGDYEAEVNKHLPTYSTSKPVYGPLTAVVGDNAGYIALMEGNETESYPGTAYSADGTLTFGTSFVSTTSFPKDVDMVTGWKLINIADNLNSLVNNYNIFTVCDQPDSELYADTSYIQGGRSTWSWTCEGWLCDWPDGQVVWAGTPTVAMMERYIDVAAKLGFEYNIIDDGWPRWGNSWKEDLKHLGELGEASNVKQILWGAVTSGTSGYNKIQNEAQLNEYFELLNYTHMYGAKIDFWWPESNTDTTSLQLSILRRAAQQKLLIDFHGCNKNTGFNVTYPNEINREGIHGGEYYCPMSNANTTEYAGFMTTQLFTRYLCGHSDWTPGTYNAMEIASIICIDSPLMVLASKPEDILNSTAVEFIKSIPTIWDQTYVLSDSRIGEYAAYAKEKSGVWFVGGIASTKQEAVKVDLSEFLPAGTYTAEIWYDEGKTMKAKMITVTNADNIDIGDLAAGSGYAIRLSKLSLNQYGGKISAPVVVTAPEGAIVKYTIDGTNPLVSPTAEEYNGGISLTESCRLTVAITSGEGKGTSINYQFNKIS